MTPELRQRARLQGSAFTWQQAITLGEGESWLRSEVSRGDIVRVLPRTYLPATVARTESVLAHAALLWAGPDAALSHLNAGVRWGLVLRPRTVTVTVPRAQRGGRPPRWLRVVRAQEVHATLRDGQRVTTLPRTICDLATLLAERDLHALLLQEVQARRLHVEDVQELLPVLGRRRGTALLRRLLDEYDPGFESLLTLELFELARRAGITDAEVGVRVELDRNRMIHPDVAVTRLRWDLEADGWAFHSSRADRERDQRRDRALGVIDWKTDRFSTDAIRRQPAETVRELARLVVARERALRGR